MWMRDNTAAEEMEEENSKQFKSNVNKRKYSLRERNERRKFNTIQTVFEWKKILPKRRNGRRKKSIQSRSEWLQAA